MEASIASDEDPVKDCHRYLGRWKLCSVLDCAECRLVGGHVATPWYLFVVFGHGDNDVD